MENDKLVKQNSNNDSLNIQTKDHDFTTPDSSGFLSADKNADSNSQNINEVNVAENEFGDNSIHSTTTLNIENAIIEEKEEVVQTPIDPVANEIASNPSNIFNIPLISSSDQENIPSATDSPVESNQSPSNIINPFNPSDSSVDYFSFQFTQPNTPQEPEPVIDKDDENVADFGFGTVIKARETHEVLPVQEDRVELTNFLQPKENIMKRVEDIKEEETENTNGIRDNNIIKINDDSASDKYRSKNQAIKLSLYSFYIFLGILIIVFIYKIYKNNTDFALTRNEITLAINSTYQAEIVSNSKVQDNTKYEWTSSNPNVVQVDENGLVTSVGGGEATITVSRANNTKTLKVTAVDIEIESITFKDKLITLKVGEEKTLQAIINDDETIVIDLLWESSDPSIATIDQNGRVTAVSVGTVSIFVYDEVSGLGGEIELEIVPGDDGDKGKDTPNKDDNNNKNVAVTGIALNKSDTIMEVGEYIVVKAVVRPANASNKSVTWSSSNKKVATVSSSGKITAVGVGTTTITATTKNGKKASIKITVTKKFVKVTSISLNKESIELSVGESYTLTPTIKPANATNTGINWSSSDESVATVSTSGKVIAKKAGTATITATTKDGNKKDICTVTVKEKDIIAVTDITLDKTEVELNVGDTITITATIKPNNATYPDVNWESKDQNVVTVSNGKITAVGPGSTTVTATTNNGKTAICTVTVKESVIEPTSVSLNHSQIKLTVGESYKLVATISPSNASNKTLTWISSKSSFASVEGGVVTALKPGTAVITVKTANGKTATCSVVISEPEQEEETPTPGEEDGGDTSGNGQENDSNTET